MIKLVHVKAIAVCLVISCVALILAVAGSSTAQQNEISNMRVLLERLLVENDFSIEIRFISSVSAGRMSWIIPDYGQGGTGERYLSEIGDDYICAEEIGAALIQVYCVPFSNIAYINYVSP
jgi:hypothetical protein